ncbi:UPF0187-domain-containing protein [Pisolithus marmoratus]|nr:UPF0187-domain-containing protein [Pisolithus marmoratus]
MGVRDQATNAFSSLYHLWTTAIFRSWRILIFFGLWSTAVCTVDYHVHSLALQPTLLTVLGTVLGFVISFRTTTSYDRYSEARKLWAHVIYASRMFARTVWFHVPSNAVGVKVDPENKALLEECQAKTLREKKSVLTMLEVYTAAIKHYLRGEECENNDPCLKFLPKYTLPSSILSCSDMRYRRPKDENEAEKGQTGRGGSWDSISPRHPGGQQENDSCAFTRVWRKICCCPKLPKKEGVGNIPLEISFHLSSYVAVLEERNDNIQPKIEPATMSLLHTSLSQLIEALTDMERIAATRVIYSKHLWLLTIIYCILLPFQTLSTLGWLTIPGTVLTSFMFFGFLVAGAEIENPFGRDKNDLNLDDFVDTICKELHSMTSRPTPKVSEWVLWKENDRLLPSCLSYETGSADKRLGKGGKHRATQGTRESR